MKEAPLSSSEAAQAVVAWADMHGELISNKKLQKLLYYVQAWSLVFYRPLFDEDFQAWVHGPVAPSVYEEYKKFGYGTVKLEYADGENAQSKFSALAAKIGDKQWAEFILKVLGKYGAFSAIELEMLSHSEKPWKRARKGLGPLEPSNAIIDQTTMKSFYKNLIDGKKEKERPRPL